MADTQRTLAALLALLADNTTGDISPQDVRDLVSTLRARSGLLSVPATGAAAVVIGNTASYFEITAPAWDLDPDSDGFDESAGNGRLTYIGTAQAIVWITATISFHSANNNQLMHFRIGVNGVTHTETEAQVLLSTGANIGAITLSMIHLASPGDYFSILVRDETQAANITVNCASIMGTTAPA